MFGMIFFRLLIDQVAYIRKFSFHRGSVHLSPFFLLEAQIRTLAGTGITLLSMDRYLSLIHRVPTLVHSV
ncbi:Energy-coupling factor transporter ATP-binding protein EcfA2 [Frankliniella fusca]|uniref:Energy-coupling factor transporter ATP-binding protein EcfA2 n=1 Tax=Frankliniella fusca TaxID=407009 RepID=A0AAE1LX79_9NEOP|nr:Energy-coupling factor transporter ATP-binding protein EcfA2 [Frankliniella fusca]